MFTVNPGQTFIENLCWLIEKVQKRLVTLVTFVTRILAAKVLRKAGRLSETLVFCGFAVMVCVLLVGFVPGLNHSEIRRDLDREHLAPGTRPITRPLSHAVGNMRGLFEAQTSFSLEGTAAGEVVPREGAQLTFEENGVSIRTAKGLAPVAPGWASPALLAIMPETLRQDGVFGEEGSTLGDYFDDDGLPLRWNSASQSCELAPGAQQELLFTLDRWDKAQSSRAYSLRQRAIRYQTAVEGYAKKFRLKPDLVYAIMYTESSFNPALISGRDAHGLMQIVPGTAGGEVNAWLGRDGVPSSEELLDPSVNIKYGTTYLHLLLTRHLNSISDPLSREFCAIASYNIGSSNMLKVFGPDWASAFATINRMTPEQVREQLLARLPARETRAFLTKVLAVREHFMPFE